MKMATAKHAKSAKGHKVISLRDFACFVSFAAVIFIIGHLSTDTDNDENFTAKHTKRAKDFLRLFFAFFAPLAVVIFRVESQNR